MHMLAWAVLWPLLLCCISCTQAYVTITVNLENPQPTSPLTYGIFFEEIGHAGDGGLYAELIQDRSFEAIAHATGFSSSKAIHHSVDLAALHHGGANRAPPAWLNASLEQRCMQSKNDIIIAWYPLPGTVTRLTKDLPVHPDNPVAMEIVGSGVSSVGIGNTGYWGIPVAEGQKFEMSLFLMSLPGVVAPAAVTIALTSADGGMVYAAAEITDIAQTWKKHILQLTSAGNDTDARLVVSFIGPGTIRVDVLSLFEAQHAQRGRDMGLTTPWPFRTDLLQALMDLKPRFLRFPGGCYVEGDRLGAAFRWKTALGSAESRPGHMNSMWGYWSTDGLGLFEYMLLAEELKAEPVWVINNGISHMDQIPSTKIMPWVQDALDSVEFITGAANSAYGSIRAAMGHPEPWTLNYLAIGNEGCGLPWDTPNPFYKPYYLQNYLAFFGAVAAVHPNLHLIASCDLHDLGPTEIWEYHVYTDPGDMFSRRHVFDGMTSSIRARNGIATQHEPAPGPSSRVFASEYAVTDGGGHGNLIGAVAEAGFMLGMERNPHLVIGGAYAPLFVNKDSVPWPTNMIVFDNHRWYGIPSYYVQKMLSEHLGTHLLPTSLSEESTLDSQATCLDATCSSLAIKLVNFNAGPQQATISFTGRSDVLLQSQGHWVQLTSTHPDDENSFDQPLAIAPTAVSVDNVGREFDVMLEPYSVNVLVVNVSTSPSVSTSV